MDSQKGKTVFIVSTRALKELEDRFFKNLSLEMSWSDAPHEVRIKIHFKGAAAGDCSPHAAVGVSLPGAADPSRLPTANASWPAAASWCIACAGATWPGALPLHSVFSVNSCTPQAWQGPASTMTCFVSTPLHLGLPGNKLSKHFLNCLRYGAGFSL